MTTFPHTSSGVLVTGATGLVGSGIIRRLLERDRSIRVFALVRHARAAMLVSGLGPLASRVTPVIGDLTLPGLGIERGMRARVAAHVRAVVHAAADTTFSRPLRQARAVNTAGTRHLLELSATCAIDRFVHISTAYVAGARTGRIAEEDLSGDAGFVNGYEQSKYEAEQHVRASGLPFVIVRPSSIVCDDSSGRVTQYNAVHSALRLIHAGFGSMMPGAHDAPMDMVTSARVIDGTVSLGFAGLTVGRTFHLCAGEGALPLGEMLDRAVTVWARDPAWRRRGILPPALTDLATYRLFEQSVEETGDVRLAAITRSLSHFVPQLAHPKRFDTAASDALLGEPAAPVGSFWEPLVEHLARTRWGAVRSAA